MWMQMIHRALWFFKSLGRWKMCVAFEARHHAATKWSKFAKKKREMWNSSVQKQRLFWPLRHFYHLGKPNSIHALWLTPSGLRNRTSRVQKNIFLLGIAPFAAEKFQSETQSFSCNLLRWKTFTRELPTLHDRCLVMFVFNTCVLLYKMFAILWTNLKQKNTIKTALFRQAAERSAIGRHASPSAHSKEAG